MAEFASSATSSGLTTEQLDRIEKNRKKAQELLKTKRKRPLHSGGPTARGPNKDITLNSPEAKKPAPQNIYATKMHELGKSKSVLAPQSGSFKHSSSSSRDITTSTDGSVNSSTQANITRAFSPPKNLSSNYSSSVCNSVKPSAQISATKAYSTPPIPTSSSSIKQSAQITYTKSSTGLHCTPSYYSHSTSGEAHSNQGTAYSVGRPLSMNQASVHPAGQSNLPSSCASFNQPSSCSSYNQSSSCSSYNQSSSHGHSSSNQVIQLKPRIKANFVMTSKEEFKVLVPYDAGVLEIFKRMDTRSYGIKSLWLYGRISNREPSNLCTQPL